MTPNIGIAWKHRVLAAGFGYTHGMTGPGRSSPDEADHPMLDAREHGDIYILSRKAARDIDRLAAEEFGIPSIILMENAARHLAETALGLVESPAPRILVVCGPGNNGGDGFAAARHLHNAGAEVRLVLAAPASRSTGDAATNLAICRKMGLPLFEADADHPDRTLLDACEGGRWPELVIDALLGTGLDREVHPLHSPLLPLIHAINALGEGGCKVVAADIPSGLDADTGEPLGAAVRADVTVTFVGLKPGFLCLGAQGYVGDVDVADIGTPRALTERLGRKLADHEAHSLPDDHAAREDPPAPPRHDPERRG